METVRWIFEDKVKSIFWEVIQKNNWKPEDFETKETKQKRMRKEKKF